MRPDLYIRIVDFCSAKHRFWKVVPKPVYRLLSALAQDYDEVMLKRGSFGAARIWVDDIYEPSQS